MTAKEKTHPYVFIIESMSFDNEKSNRYEGEIISQILRIADIKHQYHYIRTKREMKFFLEKFEESKYRYLHLSCHGSETSIETTLDSIDFDDLSLMLSDKLDRKRLFVSSCLSTNENLANKIFPVSECFSIIGSDKEVNIDDAAIFWAAFYQILFRNSPKYIQKTDLTPILTTLKDLFKVPIKYFNNSNVQACGWKEIKL